MLARMNKWCCWVAETRADYLYSHYKALLKKSGFTIMDTVQAMFEPEGYTALFLLSESHLAIHTFPERGKSYIELTSCVEGPYKWFLELHDLEEVAGD